MITIYSSAMQHHTQHIPESSGVFGFEKDDITGDTKRATAMELITMIKQHLIKLATIIQGCGSPG